MTFQVWLFNAFETLCAFTEVVVAQLEASNTRGPWFESNQSKYLT